MYAGWNVSVSAGETMKDTVQPEENPDANERRFVRKAMRDLSELLAAREQIVPPCVMYERGDV
jgi:hypothetical protein